jgi:hypothetical protein
MDGPMLRLPASLRRDLALLVVCKLAALAVLYALFFSPSHRPAIDVATHIAGAAATNK